MSQPTHRIVGGPHAGRDCWIDHVYQDREWAEVILLPMHPWPFPELGCVATKHLRRIDVYERSKQLGEALL